MPYVLVSYLIVTETDAPCLPDYTLCFRLPTLALAHLESVESSNLGRPRSSDLAADPREAPRKEAQEGCFGNLVQKM